MHPVDPEIRKLLDTALALTALAWLIMVPVIIFGIVAIASRFF